MHTQVLIVGAGPTGLTLAIDLGLRGVNVIKSWRPSPPNIDCGCVIARESGRSSNHRERELFAPAVITGFPLARE